MSSFIVTNKTINSIVSFIENNKHNFSLYGLNKLLAKYKLTYTTPDELANMLLRMNYIATDQRYGESKKAPKINFQMVLTNDYQAIKSMHCLHYQASEGEVPNTKLYKFLDELIDKTASYIIDKSVEYNKAEWDMSEKEPARKVKV